MAFALEINDLKKTYSGGVEALKGISFSVNEGDFYALLGPNGAGKSSTIGIIGSLVTKSSGNVKIFDVDIDENLPLAKTMLGVVSQEINFSQFEKVLDIVVTQAGFYGIPKKEALPKVENILKRLSLWDKRNFQARTLSGGYKRRLMIAKALIHEPKLLILDEPTAGVDIELRREMWSFLKEINENGTTIIDFSVNGESGRYANYLSIYGRSKQSCLSCNNKIKKMKVAGRGTYICTKCQKVYGKR